MKFAQIIEMHTFRWEEFRALSNEWKARTDGARPSSMVFHGR